MTRTSANKRSSPAVELYLDAKRLVCDSGYSGEIEWQEGVDITSTTESDFLRETAWVILSSGMRETVVRSKFPIISSAFEEWRSAQAIVRSADRCRHRALKAFGHKQKIESIIDAAVLVSRNGYDDYREKLLKHGLDFLQQIPYVGAITKYHLAKNIGLNVVKPDRHLCRIAGQLQYDSPQQLCETISTVTGDKVSVVDLVFWRYATLDREYLRTFDQGSESQIRRAA